MPALHLHSEIVFSLLSRFNGLTQECIYPQLWTQAHKSILVIFFNQNYMFMKATLVSGCKCSGGTNKRKT